MNRVQLRMAEILNDFPFARITITAQRMCDYAGGRASLVNDGSIPLNAKDSFPAFWIRVSHADAEYADMSTDLVKSLDDILRLMLRDKA